MLKSSSLCVPSLLSGLANCSVIKPSMRRRSAYASFSASLAWRNCATKLVIVIFKVLKCCGCDVVYKVLQEQVANVNVSAFDIRIDQF